MSKTDFIDEGRRQGLLTAYKIIKEAQEDGKDPVAVLKAELDFRRITKIMIPVTRDTKRMRSIHAELLRC